MKKNLFKRILNILDVIEVQGIERNELSTCLLRELKKESLFYGDVDLNKIVAYLFSSHFIKDTKHGIDLSPCGTIYAKADANSRVEALSLLECLYQNVELRGIFAELLEVSMHRVDLYSYFDEISYSLLTQSSLFYEEQNEVRLRREYCDDIKAIINEYEDEMNSPLLSTTLCSRYTSSIVSHENPNIEYKNQGNTIIQYPKLATIVKLIPRRGVPCDRDETKALQSFYKDTLFHEFNHACPICAIDIPHMLIASHIKPFRDCAHIYETIDHNNGLLLCRNHDYLFDQGYISFQDNGNLMISSFLQQKQTLQSYVLKKTFRLPSIYLTQERCLFLAYHRANIFKG